MSDREPNGFWKRERRRMRLREAAWLLLATAALSGLIVGSVRTELHRARERYAVDQLQALVGHLTLAMHRAANRGEDPRLWGFPLLGPGATPPGVAAGGTPLLELLPESGWLTADPWGRGFAVVLAGSERAPYPLAVTAGPDGLAVDPQSADRRWTQPLLWPPRP
jgi:hypothetical protein